MEKEKLREKALKMYAELMVQKIKEVDASDWQKPIDRTSLQGLYFFKPHG